MSTPAVPAASARVPVTLFYSYAHEDETLRDELQDHLMILERRGVVRSWHDRAIVAGHDWNREIDDRLRTADLVLLLISKDFIASDYIMGAEMTLAMERHRSGDGVVVPILLLHAFRHLGLMFLSPGAVFPGMPQQFAYPAAFGDLLAAVLAFMAIPAVVRRSRLARPLVGVFNVEGTLDLMVAISLATINDAARRHLDKLQHRHRGDSFAAAGLADDAKRLTAIDEQIHTIHRADHAVVGPEMRLQPLDVEQSFSHASQHPPRIARTDRDTASQPTDLGVAVQPTKQTRPPPTLAPRRRRARAIRPVPANR